MGVEGDTVQRARSVLFCCVVSCEGTAFEGMRSVVAFGESLRGSLPYY